MIDTMNLPPSAFLPAGAEGWRVARVEIEPGAHHVHGADPIGVVQYGFGFGAQGYDAYGNGCGQAGGVPRRE
jgi:hypothetical protein